MLTRYAAIFGAVLVALGVLGFVPALTPNGQLLGLFHVDALHNWVHLLSGIVAIGVAYRSERASELYFRIFGVLYGLIALLGLFAGTAPLLGVMAHDYADFWLHVGIAAIALYLGYYYGPRHRPVLTV